MMFIRGRFSVDKKLLDPTVQLEAHSFDLKIATHDLVTTLLCWGSQENSAISNHLGLTRQTKVFPYFILSQLNTILHRRRWDLA